MFNTLYNHPEIEKEINDDISLTVPDQAMSIAEIKARALSGSLIGLPLVHADEGDENVEDLRCQIEDLTDIMDQRNTLTKRLREIVTPPRKDEKADTAISAQDQSSANAQDDE